MTRPRIRTLKPEMWADEKIGALTRDARLLFVGLVTMADDEGRLRASTPLIVGQIFPYDPDALGKRVVRWLEEIENVGLALCYEDAGLPYVALRGWRRHQKINRAQPSELPAPPDSGLVEANALPEDERPKSEYRKRAIPERTRREVARRAGCEPGETTKAPCHWCGTVGNVIWTRLANGKPGSWVRFTGLELDHVVAEFNGGSGEPENIVLACPPCNRSRGSNGARTESRSAENGIPYGVEDGNP